MRRALCLLGVIVSISLVLAVPVLSRPGATPAPVRPHVAAIDFSPLPAVRGVVADTGPRRTHRFSLVGASWEGRSLPRAATVELRTHSGGRWSSWTALSLPDEGPDDASADARAAAARGVHATDPIWVGSADGVQARVVSTTTAAAPADLHLVLVDGGHSGADSRPGGPRPLGGSVAEAAVTQPAIYTRAQWGADERLRYRNSGCGSPSYGATIKMGFIHHTDGANGYTASQVPSIIRSIYAYHVESNGWCDIGYNFLVDRFGRIWEGRYGGITRPVIGAHTGGFNTDSFGVSMIGNYTSTSPSSSMLAAVEKLFAWKLGSYYLNPTAKTTMHAGSFSGSRYSAGSMVTFNVISGHRDADLTTCPGTAAYSKLSTIRTAVTKLIGAGFVQPTVSPTTLRMFSGHAFVVRTGVLSAQSWTTTITDRLGTTVKTITGSATPTTPVTTAWDGTDLAGVPVLPGTYTLTLTGANTAGVADLAYTTRVTVAPPVTVTAPPVAAYGSTVTIGGESVPNATVTLTLQPKTAGAPADVRTLTATSDGTWSTTFTAADDTTWSATVQGWTSPTGTTTIAPAVTVPTPPTTGVVFTRAGGSLSLAGTSLPGTEVTVATSPAGGTATTSAPIPVRPDGTWTAPRFTPSVRTTVVVRRDAFTESSPLVVYPVGTLTVTAPTTGYAQRAVTFTGNTGGAPLSVQVLTRPAGATSYTPVARVTASASGSYSARVVLPATTAPVPLDWQVVTSGLGVTYATSTGTLNVQPLFAPTAAAPSRGTYKQAITVAGNAVPGDVVTVWTRPASGGTWVRATHATASAQSTFAARFTLLRDTAWRVTSPTGATTAHTIYVRPTLHAPTSVAKGALVYVSGTAIPGQQVSVYRRPIGTTKWRYIGTVTASRTGTWTGHFHVIYPMNVVARLHNQLSNAVTIRWT